MLHLKYNSTNNDAKKIKERLQEMTLAFETAEVETTDTLELSDGTDTFQGLEAIQTYLDGLQKDLHAWYFCNC